MGIGDRFRRAQEMSGACGGLAEGRGVELWDLTDDGFRRVFDGPIPADRAPEVRSVLSATGSVTARNGRGGTAPGRVREQMAAARTQAQELARFASSVSDGPAYRAPGSSSSSDPS